MDYTINASDVPGWLICPAKQTFLSTDHYRAEQNRSPSVAALFGSHVDDRVTSVHDISCEYEPVPKRTRFDKVTATKDEFVRQTTNLAEKMKDALRTMGGRAVMVQSPLEVVVKLPKVGYVTIRGRLDLVLEHEDERGPWFELIDIKTSDRLDRAVIGRNWPQLVCYLYGLQQNHEINVRKATILFGRRGNLTMFDKQLPVDKITMPAKDMAPAFFSYMRRLEHSILEGTPVPGSHCRGCPNAGCPYHPGEPS